MAIFGMIVATILAVIFEGFTFCTLWGWFIAGTFGLTTLTIAQGIGIAMTIRFITNQYGIKKEQQLSFGESMFVSIGSCLLALVMGGILLIFM